MKRHIDLRILFLGALFLLLYSFTHAQDKPKPAPAKDTIINGVTHKLYVGAKGGRYIYVTSKAGKEYKRYFKKG